ncbi:MAG TPA: YMGG-like glycine zipper-containing protein [Stellaceae bacterium]|nr:YMGG-like glycine zipper-containing protein [Stellaceae bacterium]
MKHIDGRLAAAMAAVLTVSACAPTVMAPTVPVAPAQGKPFNQFANDQATCEGYANQQVAPLTAQANNNALGSALLGTALGAGVGAAVGGGRGAAIGAASGAALGTGVGVQNSSMAGMSIQQQYNMYYAQCMSSRGNSVPGMSPAPAGPGPGGYGPGGYGPGGYGPGGYGPGAPMPPPPPRY